MTSENDLIDAIETNEESDALIISTEETKIEQEINIEKPKRAGRKKRELTSENLNNDSLVDTQPLFEQPVIVEGKRSRKPTARLELSDLTPPKKELSIPEGNGKPLGEIEYINYHLTHASTDALSRMSNICFGRRAGKVNIRQNLREFKGFEFPRDSDEYDRHLSNLIKLKKDQLQSISDILGLSATGRNNEHAERILTFLMEPVDEGKSIPERKLSMRTAKELSTNSKESILTDEEENEIDEKTENGDDDDDEDVIFDEEEEDDEVETDDDYIGSDEESGLITKDDPDDFVYRPGKKTPTKRTSIKRSRSRSTPKRKRGASTRSKRGRKRSKVIVNAKTENEDAPLPDEPMQTNDEETKKQPDEDNSTTDPAKTDDLNNLETKVTEQNDTTTTTDIIIPTTS